MPKLIFLVGLCGSGKTRKGNSMNSSSLFWAGEGIGSCTEKRLKLIEVLRIGIDCVAEEFLTFTDQQRTHLEMKIRGEYGISPLLVVDFWFFEKDKEKARRNILSRPDGEKHHASHLALNDLHFESYQIPEGAVVLEIEPPTEYVSPPRTSPAWSKRRDG